MPKCDDFLWKSLPQTGWADKANDQTGMSCHPTTVTTGLICLGKSAQPHSQDPSEEVESIESDLKKKINRLKDLNWSESYSNVVNRDKIMTSF